MTEMTQEFRDPASVSMDLSEAPSIDPTATLRSSRLGAWCSVGARAKLAEAELGDYTYVCEDTDLAYCTLGRFCSIASGVRINPGNHPLHRAALHHFTYRASAFALGEDDAAFFDWRRSRHVTIGNDVWIGHRAIVMPGVTIGDGVAIGSGAVVTHDVPDFAVVVGVPARVLRMRFDDETARTLKRVAWWNWPHEKLRVALGDFRALDAADFCKKYDA